MAQQQTSEKQPKRRTWIWIILLIVVILIGGTAGFLYFGVINAPLELDDPQQMAAAAPMSAEERFRFSAADQSVQMKVSTADLWYFVLTNAGENFLDSINQELSAYSLSVSGCGIKLDENGAQLNLELFYKSIRLPAQVPFALEVSGNHFSLKPGSVKVGSISLPVEELLSSVELEQDIQLPVISNVTGISYEQDAVVLTGTMKEDLLSLLPPRRTVQRLAVFDQSWQSLAATLDTEEGYVALFSQLEQNPGEIEDLYDTMFMFAGYDITQAYLDSRMDFTKRAFPGIDFSSNEAKRAEMIKQENPLLVSLEQFFANVVSDYNGKIFKLIDGEFLKKLEPFHATRYGAGSYDDLFAVLDPQNFSLVLVDVENGYTKETPEFHRLAASNQEFTQPVDFKKTYILGLVFRSADGVPFLMYETNDQGSSGHGLALHLLTEEEVSALLVPEKFGVWTG